MRTITLSVFAVTQVLAVANLSMAQNGLRFGWASRRPWYRRQAAARLTSQVTTDGTTTIGIAGGSDGAAEGYVSPEAHTNITAGCAFGGMGGYGYNPDFGYGRRTECRCGLACRT